MTSLSRVLLVLLPALMCTGCGGYYVLTTPDQVAPLGEGAPVVIRLQLNDFLFMRTPARDKPMRFAVRGGAERIAHTDKQGYAGTLVPVPNRPGRYLMSVDLTDTEGEEVAGLVNVYVWDAARPVVVVDTNALPAGRRGGAAVAALRKLAAGGTNIVYLTRRDPEEHYRVHDMIAVGGYPPGPVLMWRRQRYRIERRSRFNRRLVVESRLVSQLAELRTMFLKMIVGVCDSTLAAKAFIEAGLKAVIVGEAKAPLAGPSRRASWSDLARGGL